MLRQTALAQLTDPAVILETHGGYGDVFSAVYAHVQEGVVFEKDPFRTLYLAHQRPSWAVYETDCVPALEMGAGDHLAVNLLDIDPYGNAWPPIQAFFTSARPRARKVAIVGDEHKMALLALSQAGAVGFTFEHLETVSQIPEGRLYDVLEYLIELALVDSDGDMHHRRYRLHQLTATFINNMFS